MTPEQVAEYLGFPAGTKVKREIVDGMKDVPVPHSDPEHIAAFTAFLRCAGKAPLVEKQCHTGQGTNQAGLT